MYEIAAFVIVMLFFFIVILVFGMWWVELKSERNPMTDKIPFLFEDMLRIETRKYVCRIWREVSNPNVSNRQLKLLAIDTLNKQMLGPSAMVMKLIKFERVNSVEVVDRKTGDGICLHKDWP